MGEGFEGLHYRNQIAGGEQLAEAAVDVALGVGVEGEHLD